MSKTPRTKSEAIKYLAGMWHVACDRIEELETELAEAQAEIERKDKLIEQMREALEFLRETQGYKAVNGKDSKYIHMRSEAWSKCGFALDAAERASNDLETGRNRPSL